MPANTPNLTLPYPTPDDTVDVPRDVKALAEKLDGTSAIKPPLLTTLPSSPVEGQEIYLGFAGAVWHFRHTSTVWRFVGGPSVYVEESSVDSVSSTSYVLLAGPSLTVPFAGTYLIEYGGQTDVVSGEAGRLSPTYGAPAIDADAAISFNSGGNPSVSVSRALQRNIPANTVIALHSRMSVAVGRSFHARWLKITPWVLT